MTPGDVDTVLAVTLSEDFAREAPPRRLTSTEAAKVRSLMIDEGYTRAEALVWVRDFGGSDEWHPVREDRADFAAEFARGSKDPVS